MTTPDYSTWLTKDQAAAAIGVTTKSIERFVQAGQIQQARWQRDGRGPLLAVYQPEDVEKLASERRQGPLPAFLVPGPAKAVNGNGQGSVNALTVAPAPALPQSRDNATGEDLLRALVTAAVKVMSETSQTPALFLTIPEASAVSGLSQAFLKRMIAAGTLTAIRDRGWRIRRKDLEAL